MPLAAAGTAAFLHLHFASVSPFAAVSAYAFASASVAVSVSAFAFASVGRVLCRGVRVKLFQSERERRLQTGRQGSAGGA